MSATTADRNTATKSTDLFSFPVEADAVIPLGVLVGGSSTGYAEDASSASLVILGISQERVVNTGGANAALDITVRRGRCFLANSSASPVTQAHIGQVVHAEDNQTVSAPGTSGPAVGVVESATSDGVWVDLNPVSPDNAGLSIVVVNAGTPDGDAYVTIQSAIKARQVLLVWFAATAYAAPADLGTLTATTGTLLKEDTDDALATVLTDATGLAVLNLDLAADGTVHAHATRNGITVTDSEAITGN